MDIYVIIYQNQSNFYEIYIYPSFIYDSCKKKKLDRKSRFINSDSRMITLRLRSQVLEVQLSFSYINRFLPTMENICLKLGISGNLAKLKKNIKDK